MLGAGAAYHNLGNFFRYVLCTQFIRMTMVMLPMVFATAPVDVRHLLLCGFLVDIGVMMVFANETSGAENARGYRRLSEELSKPLWQNFGMILAATLSALLAVILPRVIGYMDLFGQFLCETEYTLVSMMLLHICVMYALRLESYRKYPSMRINRYAVLVVVLSLLFLFACFVIEPLGLLFDVAHLPFGYLMLAMLPGAVCLLLFRLMARFRIEKR